MCGSDLDPRSASIILRGHHLPDGEGGKQAEGSQIEEDRDEVASIQIQQMSSEGGTQWPGDKSVGGKGKAEYGSEMLPLPVPAPFAHCQPAV